MTVLCYHAVQADWPAPIAVHPKAFAAHCSWFARHRRVAPLDVVTRSWDPWGRRSSRLVALTFDDGFASTYEHAWPLLARHGLPATMFLVAGTLGPEGRTVDWLDRPPSQPPAILDRDQILEMRDGGISFGSHGYLHEDLTKLSDAECLGDLRRSREALEDLLSRPVPFLAYPRGRHDERVRRAAKLAGYSLAFGLPERPEPRSPYALPRVGVYRGNGISVLRIKTGNWYLPIRTRLRPRQHRPPLEPAAARRP
jgi:peptidoglycan/xylan/chitin deacetylase (PgdA/CDA1 family)